MADRATALRSVRIALIGCGSAATTYRRALRQPGLRLAVCVDADFAAARRLAGGAAVAATVGEASDRFDAAIVTGMGIGMTRALHELANAGKPVLCAPTAMAAATCTSATSAMNGGGPRPFVASPLRFAPAARRVRALLAAGRIGPILRFDARLGGPPPADARSPCYWDKAVAGGGVLIDPGIHVFDLLTWWLGPLIPGALDDDSGGGVEAEAVARISSAGGASGIVELSRMRTLRNSVVLTGTLGSLEFDLDRLTLRAEPQALLQDEPAPVDAMCGRERAIEQMHRQQVEHWLEDSVLHAAPVPDEFSASDAIPMLVGLYAMRRRLLPPWERPAPRPSTIHDGTAGLAGRAVLVTGGTGFIGARLVEKLVLQGAKVTVGVRNLKRAARIARFDVRLVPVELGGAGNVGDLVDGQEVAFSLAYDFKRSGADNVALHVEFADACERHGVRRYVHLSSIAVYDDWPSGTLDERSPRNAPGSEYKIAKRAIELDLARRAAAGTLSPAILQPTIVYGPFSTQWTDRFVECVRDGVVELPRDGLGNCNGVYVDDVVDALIAAAVRPHAGDATWIISGARPFDWVVLIGGCAEALGRTLAYGDAPARVRSRIGAIMNDPLSIAKWRPAHRMLAFLRNRLGEEWVERLRVRVVALRARRGPSLYRPSDDDPSLYLASGVCSIEKAGRELNFAPAFEIDEGMRRTRDYIRWRYLGAAVDAGEPHPGGESAT